MLHWLLTAAAFLAGLAVVPAAAWLVFIYPFSAYSLVRPFLGFSAGLVLGAVFVGALAVWFVWRWDTYL